MTARLRGPVELALAVLVPAAAAGLLTLLLVAPAPRMAPIQVPSGNAARLARIAELRPIVLHGRRTVLGVGPAGPMTSARPVARPTSMAIPSLHVDAPIQPVHGTQTKIAVPPIGHAGWFAEGPRPGEPGRSVIIGHIDGRTLPGVFEHIPEIRTGSEIVIRDAAARIHRFAVVGKLQVPKGRFPNGAVYGPARRSVLVLVTCGGVYVPGEGYSDNVIVYARAAP